MSMRPVGGIFEELDEGVVASGNIVPGHDVRV